MIKITFYRPGPANNSSSSHGIIFTKKDLPTDEYVEFGWSYFTASDERSKKNYALICLYDTWRRHNNLGWEHANISYDDLKRFYREQFVKWLPLKLRPDYWEDIFDGYVDHQSLFVFPVYRDVSKGINIEFAIDWINELLSPEYVILGGNDNDGDEHPFSIHDFPALVNLSMVYRELCEASITNIAVKDEMTGEWVISKSGGGILKFKFDN